jgi:protein-L-isoaspartate(D-aspartate) O-methyltransferase
MSITNVRKNFSEWIESGRVLLVSGDGREGYVEKSPYKAIHVGAAANTIPQAVGQFDFCSHSIMFCS